MSLSASGRTWEEASSPAAVRLRGGSSPPGATAAEGHGHGRGRGHPDPYDFLPDDMHAYPGARLALLRTDLSLRWEDGERIGAEWYLSCATATLGDETLVALIYEEFCLREEYDDAPRPVRVPRTVPPRSPSSFAACWRSTGLVGSASVEAPSGSSDSNPTSAPATLYPDAGQTIAGFHLVEELGRGSFARVFLAKERQLADRLVALKVARAGSREPQTLARLQHTHIVPVHSSRTDPATGLHLLWMPYFGRLTLARVMADPQVRTARTGGRAGRGARPARAPEGAAAWGAPRARRAVAAELRAGDRVWGARMDEARRPRARPGRAPPRQSRPSNVLVTGDGMPMLSTSTWRATPLVALRRRQRAAPATLGGTIDYMAPEHLEALADGLDERVDGPLRRLQPGRPAVRGLDGEPAVHHAAQPRRRRPTC